MAVKGDLKALRTQLGGTGGGILPQPMVLSKALELLETLEWSDAGRCPLCGSFILRNPGSHKGGCDFPPVLRMLREALG